MALTKCKHTWLRWLDNVNFVRIFSFDYSKAFDSVSHSIWDKLKHVYLNPYIANWVNSLLDERKQGVLVDGIYTKYHKWNAVSVFLQKQLYK